LAPTLLYGLHHHHPGAVLPDVFIDLMTDFGFKRVFGQEAGKECLLHFVNCLIPDHEITDLEYLPTENLPESEEQRWAYFDLYCQTADGTQLIIEIQRAKQAYFVDRCLFYASHALRKAKNKGKWDYRLPKLYCIALLSFTLEPKDKARLIHRVALRDQQTKALFYDKLNFIYVQLPAFDKILSNLENPLDKWLFLIKNVHRLEETPAEMQQQPFLTLFERSQRAKMTDQEYINYIASMKRRLDYQNTIDYARQEGIDHGLVQGLAQGLEKGEKAGRSKEQINIARKLLAEGCELDMVHRVTGVSLDVLRGLGES